MANNNRCGCSGRRNSNSFYGCLNSVGGRYRWDDYPYYPGPCPDADGAYVCDDDPGERDCERRCRRGRKDRRWPCRFGVFTAMLPMAVAPNGIVPMVSGSCGGGIGDFPVNSGLITVEEAGTYLATYSVRVPEGQTVASTFTLDVNGASQSSAVMEVGGEGPSGNTAQAIFEAGERSTVALRSADALNIAESSPQPLVTLSLVRLD